MTSFFNIDDQEYINDSKYRSYISSIEKALKNFESTTEWADLIAALVKLNKIISSNSKYALIPKRVTVGKRLAQCFHPALPAGVHLKALETCDIIFNIIGSKRLAQDIFIYASGLFPLLGYSALNVRPTLLDLYEKHFIVLGKQLRPCLTGMLLGLLPGLESADYSERTVLLMDKICHATGQAFFYGCLWKCIEASPTLPPTPNSPTTQPGVRLHGLSYTFEHYDRTATTEDQLYIMGTNVDVMIRALCDSLEDPSVLIARSALDFIHAAFPVHCQQLTRDDMQILVSSSVLSVLRKDSGINKRLVNWWIGIGSHKQLRRDISEELGDQIQEICSSNEHKLLERTGSDTSSLTFIAEQETVAYFTVVSKQLVVHGIVNMLRDAGSTISRTGLVDARMFRIIPTLLEKQEIGPLVIDDIMLEVIRSIYRQANLLIAYKQLQSASPALDVGTNKPSVKQHHDICSDLIKQTNTLFCIYDPSVLWDFLGKAFEQVFDGTFETHDYVPPLTLTELLDLAMFLLDILQLDAFADIQTCYLPELLHAVILSAMNNCETLQKTELLHSLQLCRKLLSHCLPIEIQAATTYLDDGDGLSIFDDDENTSPTHQADHQENNASDKQADNTSLSSCGDAGTERTTAGSESDTDSVSEQQSTTSKPRTPRHRSSMSSHNKLIIELCLNSYLALFDKLLCFKYFPRDFKTKDWTAKLSLSFVSECHSRRASTKQTFDNVASIYQEDLMRFLEEVRDLSVEVISAGKESEQLFQTACQILIDFSSFPIYQRSKNRDMDLINGPPVKRMSQLPGWLHGLLVCACFVTNDIQLQSIAVGTLLDLTVFARNFADSFDAVTQRAAASGNSTETPAGIMAVVIIPVLTPIQLTYIDESTVTYQVICDRLWRSVIPGQSCHHHQVVELIQYLHQVAPTADSCESIISCSITSGDLKSRIDAIQRFTLLWHLTREASQKFGPSALGKRFHRSLFVLLESLQDATSPTYSVALNWLNHSLTRNGLSRILDALLLMLLHPDTARIAIQFAFTSNKSIAKENTSEERTSTSVDPESKVVAISSEGGELQYHTRPGTLSYEQAVRQLRRPLKAPSPTVTTIAGIGKKNVVTTPAPEALTSKPQVYLDHVPSDDNVTLRVNPLEDHEFDDASVTFTDQPEIPKTELHRVYQAGRANRNTLHRDGLLFDDTTGQLGMLKFVSAYDSDNPAEIASPDEICRGILDDLVEHVLETAVVKVRSSRPVRFISSSSEDSVNLLDHDITQLVSDEQETQVSTDAETGLNPLSVHCLFYQKPYDHQRVLYAFNLLTGLIKANPSAVVNSLTTTSIATATTQQLMILLLRHRQALRGFSFYDESKSQYFQNFRTSMYIEMVMTLCVYYLRSHYAPAVVDTICFEQVYGNKKVQIAALNCLQTIVGQLIQSSNNSPTKGFCQYVSELLTTCKIQKAVLSCLLSQVHDELQVEKPDSCKPSVSQFGDSRLPKDVRDNFQTQLISIVSLLIVLEDEAGKDRPSSKSSAHVPTWFDVSKSVFKRDISAVKYDSRKPIVYQPMFFACILSALKHSSRGVQIHRAWMQLIIGSLPYLDNALGHLVLAVSIQMCRNLDRLQAFYMAPDDATKRQENQGAVLPDYIIFLLESLTSLCHFCLLSTSQQSLDSVSGQASSGTSRILDNIINVFTLSSTKEQNPTDNMPLTALGEARIRILAHLPRILNTLSALWRAADASESRCPNGEDFETTWVMGKPKDIRHCILEMLNPICMYHTNSFVGALAIVWSDNRDKRYFSRTQTLPKFSDDQLVLVSILGAIKVLPFEQFVDTLRQLIKQPLLTSDPSSQRNKIQDLMPLEVSLLQMLHCYLHKIPSSQVRECSPVILSLIKEGTMLECLSAQDHFVLLAILFLFVQKIGSFEDRKQQKELQDLSLKCIESVAMIAGSSLEQTTWLRRSLVVKPQQADSIDQGLASPPTATPSTAPVLSQTPSSSKLNGPMSASTSALSQNKEAIVTGSQESVTSSSTGSSSSSASKERELIERYRPFSVQALRVLSEYVASLMDLVYSSEEKDRIAPFLTSTVLYNVFPYLKNHSAHNLSSYQSSSNLLSTISSYQYTRKAWRRETIDLVLDPTFFQMDLQSLHSWKVIVDNLMSQDKFSFKDVIARVPVATASINLFGSREQEIEHRGIMLKRLAFVVFCGETDQYRHNIPDFQERLVESLKIPQVPVLHAHVFLFFRVLLLRFFDSALASFWPLIITELIQVLMLIEQELTSLSEANESFERLAMLNEATLGFPSGANGLSSASSTSLYLRLYLAACKLLDMLICLPSTMQPQFQLYQWAFLGDPGVDEDLTDSGKTDSKEDDNCPFYIPHVLRVSELMNVRFGYDNVRIPAHGPGYPLLNMTSIRSLSELQPFFRTLAERAMGSFKSLEKPLNGQPPSCDNAITSSLGRSRSEPSHLTSQATPSVQSFSENQRGNLSTSILSSSAAADEANFTAMQYVERIIEKDFLEPTKSDANWKVVAHRSLIPSMF